MRWPQTAVIMAFILTLSLASCTSGSGEVRPSSESPLLPYRNALEQGTLRAENPKPDKSKADLNYGDIVSACMKKEGFEYWPTQELDKTTNAFDEPDDDDMEFSKRARDGYGIVAPYEELYGASSQTLDPNEEYLSTMSDEMRKEYMRVLSGTIWDEISAASQTGEEVNWDWRRGGCDGKATHMLEENAAQEEQTQSERITPFDDLIDQMNSLPEKITQSQDWNNVLERWSQCMRAQGLKYSSWDQAQDSIAEELDALASEASGDRRAAEESSDSPYKPDKAAYQKLYDRERKIAVSDWQCQIDTDRREAEAQILYKIEKDFVDTNLESLEKMKEWFELNG